MTATSYDEIPYSAYVHGSTHPYKLATVARLFGLEPPPLENCRVLEIGCASGINIIAMAESLPQAKFVGIDLSARQVDAGLESIHLLGLDNILLKQMDIMDIDQNLGTFDYIITHGIYSWVPNVVQDKILQISHANLAPNGVAYVSYNIYPGWHVNGMVRQIMLYHTKHFAGSEKQIEQAKAMLRFLVEATEELNPGSNSQNRFWYDSLRVTMDLIRSINDDAYLFHEYLEENNIPILFWQFIEHAKQHNLQYLGDIAIGSMLAAQFPPSIQEKLNLFGNDIIRQEQYMDFLRNRSFRRSLLCHAQHKLNRSLHHQPVTDLYILSDIRSASTATDINSQTDEKFINAAGNELFSASASCLKACFYCLSEAFPGSLLFQDLMQRIYALMPAADHASELSEREIAQDLVANTLLKLYINNHIDMSPVNFRAKKTVSAYPVANKLARLQVQQGKAITSTLFHNIGITPVARFLLPHLDGTHTLADLIELLKGAVAKGEQALPELPEPLTPEQEGDMYTIAVKTALDLLARKAVLVN